MTMLKQIEKEKQNLARCEKSLALEKLKKRKADTRRKIELGGLVIKAGMGEFDKAVVLGALIHAIRLTTQDSDCYKLFEDIGVSSFSNSN